jgi:uncharacterized protein (TIGR00730 family)
MRIGSLCVFCGSSLGVSERYAAAAEEMGRTLADRGIQLVYGGASVGLMGTIADSVLHHGGRVTGVITSALAEKELAHPGLSELVTVGSMHERKLRMSEMADAFVMLPGGYGTLDEFFEALTWTQLGAHSKPCAILNAERYFDPLLGFLSTAVEQGFVRAAHTEMLVVDPDPGRLLDRLASVVLPDLPKWLDSRDV